MSSYSWVVHVFEEQHIGRLLEGIRHQTLQNVEIILVGSGWTDTTAAIATRYGAMVLHIHPAEFTVTRRALKT